MVVSPGLVGDVGEAEVFPDLCAHLALTCAPATSPAASQFVLAAVCHGRCGWQQVSQAASLLQALSCRRGPAEVCALEHADVKTNIGRSLPAVAQARI
jgi:hypothetical protein